MLKKPLVLTDGEIEQLQSGDILLPVPNVLYLQNWAIITVPICSTVYIAGANGMELAEANSYPNAIGLLVSEVLQTEYGYAQTDGKLTATTAQWDVVTGESGGLTPGAVYYLSGSSAGKITTIPPTTGYLVKIGIAVNQTDLEIKISRPIKL